MMTRNTSVLRWLPVAGLAAVLVASAIPAEAQRAVPRSGERRATGSSGETQRPSGEGRGERAPREQPRAPAAERPQAQPAERPQGDAGEQTAQAPRGDEGTAQTGSSARTRGDGPVVGSAVARDRSPRPPQGGGNVIVIPGGYGGYYPWGYAGLGFGGYYDPWYGGYPAGYYDRREDGRLRLKVTPRDASVYVDGYYAGRVDDFDGMFQHLPLEPGPYRIEIRADGYAPLSFDVRILPDRKLTYSATLEALP